MNYYYKFILFYNYAGDDQARAIAFNDPRMRENALQLGAIELDTFRANSYARSLASEVNSPAARMPVSIYRMKVNDHPANQLITKLFVSVDDDD